MRILVVDDDAPALAGHAAAIHALGHEVATASSGLEACAKLAADRYSVVVTDWMMPDLDGLGLCRWIRATEQDRYTYVVLLTSLEGRTRYLEAMTAGADDFLSKPFDEETLATRLRVAERILGRQLFELDGVVPICMYCKKIRDAHDTWHHIDAYLSARTSISFSHGVCPDCFRHHAPPGACYSQSAQGG